MTSKLKCPFCEYELQENRTTNLCCPICGLVAPTKLWQALIQAKQDLEIATKALKDIKMVCDNCRWCESNIYTPDSHDGRIIAETTNKALEQIEHKE